MSRAAKRRRDAASCRPSQHAGKVWMASLKGRLLDIVRAQGGPMTTRQIMLEAETTAGEEVVRRLLGEWVAVGELACAVRAVTLEHNGGSLKKLCMVWWDASLDLDEEGDAS